MKETRNKKKQRVYHEQSLALHVPIPEISPVISNPQLL